MSEIREKVTKKYTVIITEQTLSEINDGIARVKNSGEKISDVIIDSIYSDVEFVIRLEVNKNTQESLGYKIKDYNLADEYKSEEERKTGLFEITKDYNGPK